MRRTPRRSSPTAASRRAWSACPSWDRFEQQDEATRDVGVARRRPGALGRGGHTFGWARYADDSIGIERFGASAPGDDVLDRLGINVEHVVERAKALLGT